MSDLWEQVEDWLVKNRQWSYAQNMAHVRFQLKQARTDVEKNFWKALLDRYKD